MRALRFFSVPLVCVAACGEHDQERDRVGPRPIPDPGVSCVLEPDPQAQFPCAIEKILKDRCQRCHNEPALNGAPFPLLVWNDLLYDYGGPLFEAAYPAVKADFMPYCAGGGASCGSIVGGPVQPLTPAEKDALLEYLKCPEPVYGQDCSQ